MERIRHLDLNTTATFFRHSRENGNPEFIEVSTKYWIPAFAGMTDEADMLFVGIAHVGAAHRGRPFQEPTVALRLVKVWKYIQLPFQCNIWVY
jgi:hypothetical protein